MLVALLVTSVSFVGLRLLPGDPFAPSPDDPPELAHARAQSRVQFGLDRPISVQYPALLGALARGDLGHSFATAQPVSGIVRSAITNTAILVAPALLIGLALGVALGTWQGAHAGSVRDKILGGATFGYLAVPEFLVALILGGLVAIRWKLLPATGMVGAEVATAPWLVRLPSIVEHAVLPVSVLAMSTACVVARHQRAAVIAAVGEGFVRGAGARGVPAHRILWVHVLRRTAGTICAMAGVLLPALVGGAALVERVFSWPGAGSALVTAVAARDYPVVQALVLMTAVAVALSASLAEAGAQRLAQGEALV